MLVADLEASTSTEKVLCLKLSTIYANRPPDSENSPGDDILRASQQQRDTAAAMSLSIKATHRDAE